MGSLTQLPNILSQLFFFALCGVMIYIALTGGTGGEGVMAIVWIIIFVPLHLLSVYSGLYFSFEPILDLPFNIYIKDITVPVLSLIMAFVLGTEAFWLGTLLSLIPEVIGLVMIIAGFLRF